MFKILLTLLMLVVVLIAGFSYLSYLKNGVALLPDFSSATDDISMPSLESIKSIGSDIDFNGFLKKLKGDEIEKSDQDESTSSEPTYKWLENGSWHYGNQPPENVDTKDLIKVK